MDCLISLTALCLLNPANVYVEGSMDFEMNNAASDLEGAWCHDHWCDTSARGRLEIGLLIDIPWIEGLRIAPYAWHQSFIHEGDRGQEGVGLNLHWYPFRRE